ncbi:hypothetical protein EJB05_20819, partial [Eragrostis curvula]
MLLVVLHDWIEARGFIFGPAIALALGAKFIPLRKPRKLPGEKISEEYVLEYGTDCLEMHVGAIEPGERVMIIDDLVATGGTLSAAIRLLERAGANVVECACLIGLPKFKYDQHVHVCSVPTSEIPISGTAWRPGIQTKQSYLDVGNGGDESRSFLYGKRRVNGPGQVWVHY